MKEKQTVIQPNPITTARYEFNLLEKRIMYFIVLELQKIYDTNKPTQETIFQNLCLEIPIERLHGTVSDNYKEIRKAAESMIGKRFDISEPDGWLIVGLISYAKYYSKKKSIEFEVSRKLLPYLFDLSKGFTAYAATVAISLKSIYSQRFYEFCNQWKDTGKWYVTVDKLREMLKLEDKYERHKDFRKYVLDVAQKELKENAEQGFSDIWFEYQEKKKGRKVDELQFTIYWKGKGKKGDKSQTSDDMRYVATILGSIFKEDKLRPIAENALDQLDKKKLLKPFAKRMEELEKQAEEEKKTLSTYVPLVRHILKNDFKVA